MYIFVQTVFVRTNMYLLHMTCTQHRVGMVWTVFDWLMVLSLIDDRCIVSVTGIIRYIYRLGVVLEHNQIR